MAGQTDTSYLMNWHAEDFEEAKRHIHLQLGDFSDEIYVFGKQVLVAVYVRPLYKASTGIWADEKLQVEDQLQGKTVMVLQLGPSAFRGDKSYIDATYGPAGVPKVGDWLFADSNSGRQMYMVGKGGVRLKEKANRNAEIAMYPFSGWACRILDDERFFGRVNNPHMVV